MSYIGAKFITNQRNNSEYKLRLYAIGDTFCLNMAQWNLHKGLQDITMELSVSDARVLKDHLEQFIRMNQRNAWK